MKQHATFFIKTAIMLKLHAWRQYRNTVFLIPIPFNKYTVVLSTTFYKN